MIASDLRNGGQVLQGEGPAGRVFQLAQLGTWKCGDDLLSLCVDYHPVEGFAAFRDRITQAMQDARADRVPSELLVLDMLRQAGADRHPLGLWCCMCAAWGPCPQAWPACFSRGPLHKAKARRWPRSPWMAR